MTYDNQGFLKTTKTKQEKPRDEKQKLPKGKAWQRTDKRKVYE